MKPHEDNFCGGNFQDWLEVNLTDICNGSCSWCVEKNGYHPSKHVSPEILLEKILCAGKTNIILLGGEPTLYKYIKFLIDGLTKNKHNVFITTNGSMLTKSFAEEKLKNITGLNISLHHYDFEKNRDITGITLAKYVLKQSIDTLKENGVSIRFNCNCIKKIY